MSHDTNKDLVHQTLRLRQRFGMDWTTGDHCNILRKKISQRRTSDVNDRATRLATRDMDFSGSGRCTDMRIDLDIRHSGPRPQESREAR